jgi:ubiquinone biosynthesis protein COQ9
LNYRLFLAIPGQQPNRRKVYTPSPHDVAAMEIIMIHEVEPVETRTRIPPALHRQLKAAAEQALRSLSAEVAYRLQQSCEQDERAP